MLSVSQRLRMLIENSWLDHNLGTIRVTASLGGAISSANEKAISVLKRADKNMLLKQIRRKELLYREMIAALSHGGDGGKAGLRELRQLAGDVLMRCYALNALTIHPLPSPSRYVVLHIPDQPLHAVLCHPLLIVQDDSGCFGSDNTSWVTPSQTRIIRAHLKNQEL